jgi:hypothetical protein
VPSARRCRQAKTLAQAVRDARAAHKGATLADLNDPDVILRKAHRALDETVDRLYRKVPFASDRERVEHLFGLYEMLTAPVLAAAKSKRGRKVTGGWEPNASSGSPDP